MKHLPLIAILVVMLLTSCRQRPENPTMIDALPEIYPDYIDVTIPEGIAPLNFAMADDDYSDIDVVVRGEHQGEIWSNGSYTDFSIDDWHTLLKNNRGHLLTVTVCAKKDGKWTQFRDFHISVSTDTLQGWGVTYRRIPPSYMLYSKMGIYARNLSNFDELTLVDNAQLSGNCVNCHTASASHPNHYVYHIRGDKGATVLHIGSETYRLPIKNETIGGSMVYPFWHPDGRYIAFSTNKTSQMFHSASNKRVEVYDSSSDVFIYDTEKQETLADTLIMKKYWAENCPAFSHDGRWLYFTTARRQLYPTDYDKERYSLCRVSFDAETGRIGQQVDTLISANKTGKSVTWPRPSNDGRYVMYTQTDYGYFSIWHPEADLWMLDLATGERYPLDAANSHRAESFHNWSADGHWYLFTSRREDGLYSRLYLAAITPDGHSTKPFLLPQRNPKKYYRNLLDSYNTPEFCTSLPLK